MKNSNDTNGNRTRDLPACSAVPQINAPPRTPVFRYSVNLYYVICLTDMLRLLKYQAFFTKQNYHLMWVDVRSVIYWRVYTVTEILFTFHIAQFHYNLSANYKFQPYGSDINLILHSDIERVFHASNLQLCRLY